MNNNRKIINYFFIALFLVVFYIFNYKQAISSDIENIFTIDKHSIINNEIDERKFYIAGFDDKSQKILAMAPISDINLKKQNKNYRLYLINISNNPNITTLDIPLFNIQQYLIDNDKLYIIGNNLTTLALINLNNFNFNVLTQVEIGKPSFRYFGLIWLENNSIFAPGYEMDEKQFSKDTYIYKLNITENKVNFINTSFNITKIEKEQKPIELVMLNSEKIAILKQNMKNKKIELITIDKNYKTTKIEEGDTFGGLAFSYDYLLYSFKLNKNIYYSLYDFNKEKVFIKEKFDVPLMYPFISKNSNTIILTNYNPKLNKMDIYLGKKDENYKLNKVIEQTDSAYIKISKDGKYFLMFNIKGYLNLYKIN